MPGSAELVTAFLFDCVDWIAVLSGVCALLTVRLQRIPWIVPATVRPSPLFLFLALGWVAIRAGFWGHFWLHGSHDERPGSFPLHGVVYSREQAEAWQFDSLVELIDRYWYFPAPVTPSDTPKVARDARQRLIDGALEAEAFRREILQPDASGVSDALRLARETVRFQHDVRTRYTEFRPIDDFELSERDLMQRMSGEIAAPTEALGFQAFEGHWYGNWDGHDVDHLWSNVRRFSPPWLIENPSISLKILTLQYAWIGDGFGWNLVVEPENSASDNSVILGTVYHVRDQNPDSVYLHRPHVGIELSDTQLIWITRQEVFLEQTNDAQHPDRYTITGFYYTINERVIERIRFVFQSQYTRVPDDRPRFRKIILSHE